MKRVILIRVFIGSGKIDASYERNLKTPLKILDKRVPDFFLVGLEVNISDYRAIASLSLEGLLTLS